MQNFSEEQGLLTICIRSLNHMLRSTELLCVSDQNNAIVIFCVALRASLLFFKTRERRIAQHRVASWTIIITTAKLFPARLGIRPLSYAHLFKMDPIVPRDYFKSSVYGIK